MSKSFRQTLNQFGVLFFALVLSVGLSLLSQNKSSYSVELGIAERSPLGTEGGLVVPASAASLNCQAGWAPNPSGALDCVETGYCDEYYYYNWSSHSCQDCLVDTANPQTQVLNGCLTQQRTGSCPVPKNGPVWSEWVAISNTCSSPTPPSVSANPTTVTIGDPSTITWACGAGDTSSAGGGISTGGATSGSVQVNPTTTTTYTVQCSPSALSTPVTVTIQSPTLTISATPSRVRSGTASNISWSATNVTSCTLKNGATTLAICSSNATCSSAHNTSTGILTAQSVFTLICGTATATATVFITPRVCEVGTANCPE